MTDFPEYAFPAEIFDKTPKGPMPQRGMALRDWFAGQALAGMCGHPRALSQISDEDLAEDAKLMYRFADAMLAARAKGGGQ